MVEKTLYPDGKWEYDFSVFDIWVEFMFSLGIDRQINCYSMIPWKLTFDYVDRGYRKNGILQCRTGIQRICGLLAQLPMRLCKASQGKGVV